MWYCLIGKSGPNSAAARLKNREAHLERLQALQDQGRMMTAGPLPAIDSEEPGSAGFSGSLIIAEFGSLPEARHWFAADPYNTGGVYQSQEVYPFKKVFPT